MSLLLLLGLLAFQHYPIIANPMGDYLEHRVTHGAESSAIANVHKCRENAC